jgi:hypothetical protein
MPAALKRNSTVLADRIGRMARVFDENDILQSAESGSSTGGQSKRFREAVRCPALFNQHDVGSQTRSK